MQCKRQRTRSSWREEEEEQRWSRDSGRLAIDFRREIFGVISSFITRYHECPEACPGIGTYNLVGLASEMKQNRQQKKKIFQLQQPGKLIYDD